MTELKVIPIKCPSCGAKLELTSDMDRFMCGYCGTEMITQRKGGTVSIKPLTEAINRVQVSTDKTAAELAIQRLKSEIDQLNIDKESSAAKARKRISELEKDLSDINTGEKALVEKRKSWSLAIGGAVLVLGVMLFAQWLNGLLSFTISLVCGCLVAFVLSKQLYKNALENKRETYDLQLDMIMKYRDANTIELKEYDRKVLLIKEQIDQKKRIADA